MDTLNQSHWNALRGVGNQNGYGVYGVVTSVEKQQVNICYFLSSHLFLFYIRNALDLACFFPTYGCALVQLEEWTGGGLWRKWGHWAVKKVRLLLLPLVSCFRLLSLNHAAAYDAVKAPQVEEGNGPK